MTPRALVVLGSLLAIALPPGCKTAAGTLPGWDDPVEGDAVAAAPDDAGDGADAGAGDVADDDGGEASGDPTAVAAADPSAGSRGAPGSDTTAKPDPSGDAEDPEPDDGADAPPAALPDPVYTKIDKKCGKDPGVGERLKAFDLATSDGGKVTQGTYRGRVLVVNFWGTWCKPCLKELPEFDQLYRRYRKHGMTLLAIATDEDATAVNEFKKKRRLAAKLAIGGEDYAGKYSSTQFPFTFVVDTKGVIKSSYRGYKPECMGKLEDDIRTELDKRAKARGG